MSERVPYIGHSGIEVDLWASALISQGEVRLGTRFSRGDSISQQTSLRRFAGRSPRFASATREPDTSKERRLLLHGLPPDESHSTGALFLI